MKIGASTIAARTFGAVEVIDARPFLAGKLKETYEISPNICNILPAMRYSDQQLKDMETTINSSDCDAVIIGTPIDLNRIINIKKPTTRVYYDLEEIGYPKLSHVINQFTEKHHLNKEMA